MSRQRVASPVLSRRHMVAGASAAGACALIAAGPDIACAQRLLSDGFHSLRAQVTEHDTAAATSSATWCFEGTVPGPLLRARRGTEMRVRLINDLPVPATVHWHGVRIVNGMDGAAGLTQPPVPPGATFDCRFLVPDAGTFWYRAWCADASTARSLHGGLIVGEIEPVEVDHDEVLVLDAWRPDGRDTTGAGRSGASPVRFTANGRPCLEIPVKVHDRLRLRLINAAPDWVFALGVDGHRAVVMAIDGEPAEPFEARDGRVMLGPGNRVDLFVDATRAPGEAAPLLVEQHDGVALCRLLYEAGPPARPAPLPGPRPLPSNGLPERMAFEHALRMDLEVGADASPGPQRPAGPAAAPLFSVRRGRTVMLALGNRRGSPSAVHLHGHHFRLLDNLDDGWKPFWLDTMTVPSERTVRLAFVADNPGKWLIEQSLFDVRGPSSSPWFEVA